MYTDSDAVNTSLILLAVGIYVAVVLLIVIGNYVLYSIALSMFFRKVGVEPWIGWVPFYAQWKWLEVGGHPGWLSLLQIVPYGNIVYVVFQYIGMWRSNIAFGRETGIFVLGIFFPFVWLFVMASRDSVYRPELITQAGYGPPLAGYGARPASS
jgi:hypothetical protein